MVTITKGMFIEIDYTGRLAQEKTVFDTTLAAEAKKAGLTTKSAYRPVIICVGEGHVLPGIDAYLEGKSLGTHSIAIPAEKAFGKKDAKLLKLIPLAKFKESEIQPFQGLEVNIDGHYGVVRTISGGRVTVDFNHPLAGRDVSYDIDVKRVVEKSEERIVALLDMMGMHNHGIALESPEHVVIKVHSALPHPIAEGINSMITRLIPAIKNVTYHVDAAGHDHAHGNH